MRARSLAGCAALLATALAAAGCGNTSTSPGAAALVGSVRISVDALQRTVDRALADPQAKAQLGGDRAGFTRNELSRLIDDQVVAAAAKAHGITVTRAEVDQQIAQFAQQAGGLSALKQQAAQGGVPTQDLSTFIRYYVLQQKLADALVANVPVSQAQLQAAYQQSIDQFDQVHSAHILVKTRRLAQTILRQARANPSSFASLAQKYSLDTSNKNSGGDLGFAGRGQFVPVFSAAIFAARPGSFILVHSQFGWHVVHVIAHRTVSLAQAAPQLKASILKSERDRLLQQALTAASKKLGVHVNPRYGRWDAVHTQVVPIAPSHDVSSPAPRSG